jgi:hypothetical protein
MEPGSLSTTIWVGDQRKEAERGDLGCSTGFFCERFGSVLVACGERFRLSACLPGSTRPPPDMQQPGVRGLHRALSYSPAAGCMVLEDTRLLGGLKLAWQGSSAGTSDGPSAVRSTLQVQMPAGQQVTCCALSPDGAWLLIGTSAGEVHLAAVPSHSGAAVPAASAGSGAAAAAAGCTAGDLAAMGSAAASSNATAAAGQGSSASAAKTAAPRTAAVVPELLGSQNAEVTCCAFHPTCSGYVAVGR